AGAVPVAEPDAHAVPPDELHRQDAEVGRDRRRVEERPAGHLLDALGAAAAEPEVARPEAALVVLVPNDAHVVAAEADDLDGERVDAILAATRPCFSGYSRYLCASTLIRPGEPSG